MSKASLAVQIDTSAEGTIRDDYKWSKEAEKQIKSILSRYPKDRSQSAVIPLLSLAQDEFDGWLPTPLMELVADTLSMPYTKVYEVATFYTMFNLKPVGKYHVQVCTNCSCMIRGGAEILELVKKEVGVGLGEVSKDGMFTVSEVECLGACVNAPMMQINKHYYTDLDKDSALNVIKELRDGSIPKPGSQTGRN